MMSQGNTQPTAPMPHGAKGAVAYTDGSLVWEALSARIDALVAAWQNAVEPPALADFVPAEPAAVRRLTLVEAIKVDLEYRWQGRRWPKLIEQYAAEFPELSSDSGLPCDLIYEEYHVRRQIGDSLSVVDYCNRFPERADELARLFQLATHQTTSLMSKERVPTFEVGQRLDDFDLLVALGKGAFGSVFLARQRSMQRLVALKISRDRGFEPQTLAQLEHPHIVRVFDQRQLPDQKLRLLYMQYVAGGTLQDVVEFARKVPENARSGATLLEAIDQTLSRRGETLPTDSMTRYRLQSASWPEAVCWLGARLAGALAYAHARGVLHRDIKPANVLVGADGQPRLADFNTSFSKLDGTTPAAYFGGTLAYMSPEQLEACDPAHEREPEDLDGRSDVYSLGVMLWELLTLQRPFARAALPRDWSHAWASATAERRAGISAESRAMMPGDYPPMVVDVLLKCLEPDADRRYASAAELARELDLCLQPRAHALMHGRGAWRSMLKRHPVATTIGIGLLPNIVMCIVNIIYNWQEIVNRLGGDEQRVFGQFLIIGVNAVAYSIGLGYVVYTRGKVFLALGRLARGERVEPPPTPEMSERCLTLGYATAVITAILWSISGYAIPLWIQYSAGPSSTISADHYQHFMVSNLLCGMISATQSYYVVTYLSLRYCYPWLLKARAADARPVAELAAVARRGRVFLALTVAVPFLALPALVLINFDQTVIAGLGVLGLFGCGLAYFLDLTIRGDIAALAAAMNPTGDLLGGIETLDSFLSGSTSTRVQNRV